jgi:hypothetical protein
MSMSSKLVPWSELLRLERWSRAEGYDRIHRNQVPIPVTRVGSRYFVHESDLAQLRKAAP